MTDGYSIPTSVGGDFGSSPSLRPFMVLSLPLSAHRRKFKAAAFDIDLIVEGTKAIIVAMTDYVAGEPPPPLPVNIIEIQEGYGEDDESSASYTFAGYILGPLGAGSTLDPKSSKWGREVIAILESHGLKELTNEISH